MPKRILLGILFLISLSASLLTQGKWKVLAGVNCFAFKSEIKSLNPRFLLGIGREWALHEYLSFSSELLYIRKGGYLRDKVIIRYPWGEFNPDTGEYEHINPYTISDIDVSIAFIEIPLLLRFYYSKNRDRQIQMYLGPGLSMT